MTQNTTPATAAAAATELLQFVTPEQVADAIKAAGCAVRPVEQEGVAHLRNFRAETAPAASSVRDDALA